MSYRLAIKPSASRELERLDNQLLHRMDEAIDGEGVRWPDSDEDINVEGMLRGMPAHRPRGHARARE